MIRGDYEVWIGHLVTQLDLEVAMDLTDPIEERPMPQCDAFETARRKGIEALGNQDIGSLMATTTTDRSRFTVIYGDAQPNIFKQIDHVRAALAALVDRLAVEGYTPEEAWRLVETEVLPGPRNYGMNTPRPEATRG